MSRKAASVSDYRALAKARLPHFLFEYLDGGSYDEETLRRNVEDLRNVALRQRVLRDVSAIDLSSRIVRDTLGDAGRAWAGRAGRALCPARRGPGGPAAAERVPFTLSTVGACSLREVAAAGHVPWYQLYFVKDRGFVASMIDGRAKPGAAHWC